MMAYCPEDAYCEMVAALAKERRERFEEIAAEFLGRNNRRLGELADLLEHVSIMTARGIEP
jgi:hypothetical protein